MEYSSVSVAGKRQHNEDSCLATEIGEGLLLAVADGIGGHAAGDVASKIAIEVLRTVFLKGYEEGMDTETIEKLLKKAFQAADSKIDELAIGERTGMGTTLVTAFVTGHLAFVANTGDSRAYIYSGGLRQITIDHSLVQELVERGAVDQNKRRFHPMKNIITHSLGGDFRIDIFRTDLAEGDVLLLSSDGLHDYIDDETISGLMASPSTANSMARSLIRSALSSSEDNISVVLLRV